MKQKWVKRIARAMLPCFVFFVFSFSFAPKAHALEFTGNLSLGLKFYNSNYNTYLSSNANVTLPLVNGSVQDGYGSRVGEQYIPFFNTYPEVTFTGPAKLYASFYLTVRQGSAGSYTKSSEFYDLDEWQVTYINHLGQTGVNSIDSFDTFAPSSSNALFGEGYALEAQWSASEDFPIRALQLTRDYGTWVNAVGGGSFLVINYPSVRLITSTYSEEINALDKVADEISAQSNILLAMKGDLVAILQDIYAMTGDMYIAQNLLNTYISQMLPLLEDIDETTTNIYNLLSTQLRLLETAIENAADSIEAAISAQTSAMIAYLESVLNTGNEVPDDTYKQQQDAANILDQMESLEKPNVDTIVPEIGDYSDSGVSGVLSAIFSSNLIVTMMTLSASFAFGAYVLFGKRE